MAPICAVLYNTVWSQQVLLFRLLLLFDGYEEVTYKFSCVAQFRHKATQSALQGCKNYIKIHYKQVENIKK